MQNREKMNKIFFLCIISLVLFSCAKQRIETAKAPHDALSSDSVTATTPDGRQITWGETKEAAKEMQTDFLLSIPEQKKAVVYKDYPGNPLPLIQMTKLEKEQFITGEWMRNYPTPASNWGYIFYNDSTFKYYEDSKRAVKNLFLCTYGSWRLMDNNIEVKLSKYETSDRAADENTPAFLSYPSDAKEITTELQNQDWHRIGTLESVLTDIKSGEWDIPPQIELAPILLDNILINEPLYYYKFN